MLAALAEFIHSMGIFNLTFGHVLMIGIACLLIYLAIVKGFEPLLLIPIAFGVLLTNLPLADMMAEPIIEIKDKVIHTVQPGGLMYYLFQGDHLGIFPPLIFLGVGAMTDFGPLIANPKSLLRPGRGQLGIFITFIAAIGSGLFTAQEAASIGIIGGADGPTAISSPPGWRRISSARSPSPPIPIWRWSRSSSRRSCGC